MATAAKTGFAINCPHCGATEAVVIQAHDLAVVCRECDDSITRHDLLKLIEDARRLLAWLDMASEA